MGLTHAIAAQVVDAALELQLLPSALRPSVLRFMPALRMTPGEIGRMLEILHSSFRIISR